MRSVILNEVKDLMTNSLLIIFGKLISRISLLVNLGAGSTWPGHLALIFNPNFLKDFQEKFKGRIILIAGTNGKTTTCKMIKSIVEAAGKKVIHNQTGANLLNGIASTIILRSNIVGKCKADLAIFEVDENTLPEAASQLKPDFLILLNLFRDQLDRYGEIDTIAQKWKNALSHPDRAEPCQLILNADDPCLAFLGQNLKNPVFWFGIENEKLFLKEQPHAMDVIYCPACDGKKLEFSGIYFAHLGKWHCPGCGFARPKISYQAQTSPMPGIYNLYNLQAAILVCQKLGVVEKIIKKGLANFIPAFGRQEEFKVNGKKVKIFLSKNPTGFNETIRTVKNLGGQNFLLVLNDRIPDGRDVSWIWDVDFEELDDAKNIIISGERAFDMGLRMKYSLGIQNSKFKIIENLEEGLREGLKKLKEEDTLYILPTYSAMLEVRKILSGRKIL